MQSFINDLDLSASTIKTIFSIIKSTLSSAEDNGLISNIYMGQSKIAKKNKFIVQILTVTEQKQLESMLISSFDIGVWISLYAGLRIGEVEMYPIFLAIKIYKKVFIFLLINHSWSHMVIYLILS